MSEFIWKDNVEYDELYDVKPAAAVINGQAAVRQDVFGFYLHDTKRTAGMDEITFVYRCRQVEATKATGSGQAITSGDKLYHVVANNNVTPAPSGVAGTDYYFCGWAKETVTAAATVVLMNFDGTRYNENI